MTIQESITAWLKGRPSWQQSVAVRLCAGEVIDTDKIEELANNLIDGVDEEVSVSNWDIPGASARTEAVRISELRSVEGINALAPDQSLSFADKGITIVYGDNGSGKSGYARLLRTAVRARVSGKLLGNVFNADASTDQHAVFEYAAGDSDVKGEWKWGEPLSSELAQVQFYDDDCGRAYISTASQVKYRPSALTLLDQLVRVCDAVRKVLDDKLQENASSKIVLPNVETDTTAGKFLSRLSGETSSAEITHATAADENDLKNLTQALHHEANLKGSDPTKEKHRLNSLAVDYKAVAAHCISVQTSLSKVELDRLAGLKAHTVALRTAADIASQATFAEEPLNGVGTEAWRKLWETARAYSVNEAYPDHTFPHTATGANCVLCQQPLDSDSAARLNRFQEFMVNTTEKEAKEAEQQLASTLTKVALMQSDPQAITAAVVRIRAVDEGQGSALSAWLLHASRTAATVFEWLDKTGIECPPPINESPAHLLSAKEKEHSALAADIDSASFRNQLNQATSVVKELQAKISISAEREAVLAEVARLAAKAIIESKKKLTDTAPITRKSSELSKQYVTSLVRDQFTRETERLRLRRVTLDPKSGKKGSLQHLPSLLQAASTVTVTQVLSEGEKTALGLAGFFTEVEFNESHSSVVLDDPITSLDHSRRSIVAKRIVDLAETRQVIVFTHDVIFVGDLVKHAGETNTPVSERWISRRGDVAGYCTGHHPWKAKDVAKRLDELQNGLAKIGKNTANADPEVYEESCASWAGKLSETWERSVNMEIVYEVVDRGTSQVRPQKFRILASITAQDNDDFQQGYGRTSEWARRHDKDPEINFEPPTLDEMENELNRITTWFKRIKSYRK